MSESRPQASRPLNELDPLSGPQRGLVAELVAYVVHTRKWWLAPILVMLFLLAALILLGSTGAAPFIYTLF